MAITIENNWPKLSVAPASYLNHWIIVRGTEIIDSAGKKGLQSLIERYSGVAGLKIGFASSTQLNTGYVELWPLRPAARRTETSS